MESQSLHREHSSIAKLEQLALSITVTDTIIAKALKLSEISKMARLEANLRKYIDGVWITLSNQAASAAQKAIEKMPIKDKATKKDIDKVNKIVDSYMEKWAKQVTPRFIGDVEKIYKLARTAGHKKATGHTPAALVFNTPKFEKVAKAAMTTISVNPSFNVADKNAIAALKKHQVQWVGEHYDKNVSKAISETTSKTMIEAGVGTKAAGAAVKKSLKKELGKIRVPKGFAGTSKQYFEGLTANAATTARAFGQLQSFSSLGLTRYTIVNPSDERTCPVCSHMDGKMFTVSQGLNTMNGVLSATSPAGVKSAQPWMSEKQLKDISAKPGAVGGKDAAALSAKGFNLPPFHFRCRCAVDMDVEEGIVFPVGAKVPTAVLPKPKPVPKPIPKPQPAPKRFATSKEWHDNLNDKEAEAMTNWVRGGHANVREFDAGIGITKEWWASQHATFFGVPNAKAAEYMQLMGNSLERAPVYKGRVYRGLNNLTVKQAESIAKAGNTIELEAISSFTSDIEITAEFAEAVTERGKMFITMEAKVSSQAYELQASRFWDVDEAEVLITKGKRWKVNSVKSLQVKNDDGILVKGFHVRMEEL